MNSTKETKAQFFARNEELVRIADKLYQDREFLLKTLGDIKYWYNINGADISKVLLTDADKQSTANMFNNIAEIELLMSFESPDAYLLSKLPSFTGK